MLSVIPNQVSAAAKAHCETQLNLWMAWADKTMEGVVQLAELNMNAVKSVLSESAAASQQLLSVKDPSAFFSLAATQAQPNMERVLTYAHQVAGIATSMRTALTQTAQAQLTETNRKLASGFAQQAEKTASRAGK